jgi:hypothetical protein
MAHVVVQFLYSLSVRLLPLLFLVATATRCASGRIAAHLRRPPGHLRWSYAALLPCPVDVEKLRGMEGELWLLVLVGKGSFHLLLLRCLVSRDKSGVARFCSVMIEMSSHLGSHGPSSGRAGRSLCYSHVHHFKKFCTFIYYLWNYSLMTQMMNGRCGSDWDSSQKTPMLRVSSHW